MALTTNTQTNAGGIVNQAMGNVVTDAGAAADTVITPGFTPRYVKWMNVTDGVSDEWYNGMASGSSLHTVAAGTRTLVAAPAGVTIGTGSFTIPAAIIPASKTFVWEAVG